MLDINISKKHKDYSLSGKHNTLSGQYVLFTENQDTQAIMICKKRMPFAHGIFIIAYFTILIKIFYSCLSNGIIISGFEEITKEKAIVTPVSRADIIDRNGTIIATSLPTVNLQVSPKYKIKNLEEVAHKLSIIFPDLKYENILKNLKKQKNNDIKRNLSPAQQAEVNNLGIPALEFKDKQQARVYPLDNLFSHILGYTNIDNIGISGIEKSMNERLTKSSKPLQLTVDTSIQDTIREELKKAISTYKAIGAVAILMDVNNGEVISMVSLPDYNPNIKIPSSSKTAFNFATQGVYEAGSIFKTFNTALSLDSKKVKVNDKFDVTKPLKIKGKIIRDFHPKNKWLSVGEILVHSSNIGSVQMIYNVGKEKQREFLVNLGFSERLSEFEVLEKEKPLFPSEKNWSELTMATVSYGYGLSATPLHIISAFNALVNGGIYYYPTIVKNSSVPSPKRVISESTSKKIIPLLRDVVAKSSTKSADIEGYQVIGKTGSAEKIINGKYSDKNITSFLAAFPASSPKYSLIVVLDEPHGTKGSNGLTTAGWNAAPTAGNIIKTIAPQLNVPVDFDVEEQRKHIKANFEKY